MDEQEQESDEARNIRKAAESHQHNAESVIQIACKRCRNKKGEQGALHGAEAIERAGK